MSEYVVELKNATKRFPGVVALRNMQLAVKPGEILGLIGENGAGKSTLIKVLTGVHQADEGQIFVDGVEQHFMVMRAVTSCSARVIGVETALL